MRINAPNPLLRLPPETAPAPYNQWVMATPTRRDALVTIAGAGLTAPALSAREPYSPQTFSPEDYALLGDLVELMIPESDTPGAKQANAHAIVDAMLADRPAEEAVVKSGLWSLRAIGFSGKPEREQISTLTEYSQSEGSHRKFFETLKSLTVDAYYSTQEGLVQELGYKGNTYLTEFPGCTHDHEIDEAD